MKYEAIFLNIQFQCEYFILRSISHNMHLEKSQAITQYTPAIKVVTDGRLVTKFLTNPLYQTQTKRKRCNSDLYPDFKCGLLCRHARPHIVH